MKLGVISDIHSNVEALEAVLAELRKRGASRFLCLGDIVGYGPDPCACIKAVRELRGPVVAGNHDFGVVGRTSVSRFNSAARQAVEWTEKQLGERDRLYLDNLPLSDDYDSLHLVHASPSAPDQWEYVFTVREAEDEMDSFSSQVCLVGHSHYPFVVECEPEGRCRFVKQNSVELRPECKYLVNAGSVGQPRDGNPQACGLVYDVETSTLTLVRVTYDVAAVQKKIHAAGLPQFLATRLAVGH